MGQVLNRYKVGKHFNVVIQADSFNYERNKQSIEREAALDGLYVIRTSVTPEVLSSEETVKAYKSLSQVEQASRSFKTVDLKVRPTFIRQGSPIITEGLMGGECRAGTRL